MQMSVILIITIYFSLHLCFIDFSIRNLHKTYPLSSSSFDLVECSPITMNSVAGNWCGTFSSTGVSSFGSGSWSSSVRCPPVQQD